MVLCISLICVFYSPFSLRSADGDLSSLIKNHLSTTNNQNCGTYMQEKVALEKSHNARNVFSTSIPRTRIKIVFLNNLRRNASCNAIIWDILGHNRISTNYIMSYDTSHIIFISKLLSISLANSSQHS